MAYFTSPQGVPMVETREFSAKFRVHPKHVPFIIGVKGVTIKSLCKRSGSFIRIENPNNKNSGEFPWFKISANNIRAVEVGFQLVRETANKADQKMPLMGRKQSPPPLSPVGSSMVLGKDDGPKTPPVSPSYSPGSPTYAPERRDESSSTDKKKVSFNVTSKSKR